MILWPSWFLLIFQNIDINGHKNIWEAVFYHFQDFAPSQLVLSSVYSLKIDFVYLFKASSEVQTDSVKPSDVAGSFYATVFMALSGSSSVDFC